MFFERINGDDGGSFWILNIFVDAPRQSFYLDSGFTICFFCLFVYAVLYYHRIFLLRIYCTFNINAIFHRFCLLVCVNLNDIRHKKKHELVNKTPTGLLEFFLPFILNATSISIIHFCFKILIFTTRNEIATTTITTTFARTIFLLQREKGICSGNHPFRIEFALPTVVWALIKEQKCFGRKGAQKRRQNEKQRPIVFGAENMVNKSRTKKIYAVRRIIYLVSVCVCAWQKWVSVPSVTSSAVWAWSA